MDLASNMENRTAASRGRDIPMFRPDRDNPLCDPNRPAAASPAEVANSLFVHIRRGLLAEVPSRNPLWARLRGEAHSIRHDQRRDDVGYEAVVDDEMAPSAVSAMVRTVVARDALYERLDAANPADKREEARQRAMVEGTTAAFERHPSKPANQEEREFRDALRELAKEAVSAAKVHNEDLAESSINMDAPEEEVIQPKDPRRMLLGWVNSMPAKATRAHERWTDNYKIEMPSVDEVAEESVVMRGFMEIALKHVDARTTPSAAELASDVAKLADELSRPEIVQRSHRLPSTPEEMAEARRVAAMDPRDRELMLRAEAQHARPAVLWKAGADVPMEVFGGAKAKGQASGEVSKTQTRNYVRRPAIVGGASAYRGFSTTDVGVGNDEAVRSLRDVHRPLVGLEGQNHFAETAVVAGAIAAMRRPGRMKASFVSHAPKGTAFRDALEAGARTAKLDVMAGRIEVSGMRTKTFSDKTRQHVDGAYAGDTVTSGRTKVRTLVEVKGREEGAKSRWVDFESPEGQRASRGKLVIFDVAEQGRIADWQRNNVLANSAALMPARLVAFGNERNGAELYRVLARRKLSERSQAYVVLKTGKRARTRDVNAQVAARTQTSGERKGEMLPSVREWPTSGPAAQLLAAKLLSPGQARAVAEFATVGKAVDAAKAAIADSKGVPELAAREGVSLGALGAAIALNGKASDGTLFRRKVLEVTKTVEQAREGDTSILATPGHPLLRRTRAMVGFSSAPPLPAAKGHSVAIVGDEAPVSPALAANIERTMSTLADKYGRDADGVARFRVNTTLTEGVGEAVMDAALKLRVPVDAVSHLDDRRAKADSPELRLLGKAVDLANEGLGGTWSLHTYGEREPVRTAAMAARVAMEASDAIVVARLRGDDPRTLAAASAGQERPVIAMGASDPDRSGYGGNHLLSQPGREITVSWAKEAGSPMAIAEHASTSTGRDGARSFASVSTGAGATLLASLDAVPLIREAAMGNVDLAMGRGKGPANPEAARWDVLDKIDLERWSEGAYRSKVALTPKEKDYVDRVHTDYTVNAVNRVFGKQPDLAERMAEAWGAKLLKGASQKGRGEEAGIAA